MNVRATVSKNLVALIMVPFIVGAHYTWYKLQQDERLVSKSERDNLPLFTKNWWNGLNAENMQKLVTM